MENNEQEKTQGQKIEQENPKVIIHKESTYNKVIPVSEWIGVVILMAIPLVNIIVIIVWASSSTTNPNKKNYALAILIIWGVLLALFFLLGLSFAGIFGALSN